MDRTRFYAVETVNGVQEFDFLHNALSSFKLKYQPGYYRVINTDLGRPELISAHLYDGNLKYWWAILLFNGIKDPLNDLQAGQILTIPNVLDLAEIFKQFKLR